jgi:5,10-methenyltetrahydrofolate synthetase
MEMPIDGDDETPHEYASPACFLHELDPSYAGLTASPTALAPEQVALWRKAERNRLIRKRQGIATDQRRHWDTNIIAALEQVIGHVEGLVISAYWPFRGEPDLRPLMANLIGKGARTALPVVVAKGQPLLFRLWKAGDRLDRGVWNIPIPADGEPALPDIVIAPLVGFDRMGYRLGYGGGFFDRTLARLGDAVRAIGVGYSKAEIPTIYPQPHDIAMEIIVTQDMLMMCQKHGHPLGAGHDAS